MVEFKLELQVNLKTAKRKTALAKTLFLSASNKYVSFTAVESVIAVHVGS
jgi:hypothetical protein